MKLRLKTAIGSVVGGGDDVVIGDQLQDGRHDVRTPAQFRRAGARALAPHPRLEAAVDVEILVADERLQPVPGRPAGRRVVLGAALVAILLVLAAVLVVVAAAAVAAAIGGSVGADQPVDAHLVKIASAADRVPPFQSRISALDEPLESLSAAAAAAAAVVVGEPFAFSSLRVALGLLVFRQRVGALDFDVANLQVDRPLDRRLGGAVRLVLLAVDADAAADDALRFGWRRFRVRFDLWSADAHAAAAAAAAAAAWTDILR